MRTFFAKKQEKDHRNFPQRPIAGFKHVGETRSVLDISRGRLGHQRKAPSAILTMQKAFNLRAKAL
jgi:hypothetical protein